MQEKTWQSSSPGSSGDKQEVRIRSFQQVVWAPSLVSLEEYIRIKVMWDKTFNAQKIKAQQARYKTPVQEKKTNGSL